LTEPERRCPTCGAQFVDERRVSDAASDAPLLLWHCKKHHWWLQSFMHGWIPIDPGAIARDEATTTRDDE
jgi:hypothetical protein